jgi:ParB/RepB/Spo0J family partition protein
MSRDILISLIDPDPAQPRKWFDPGKLEELAASVGANGLAVPILLRPNGERFVIVHGERRWRAAQLAGWQTIPAEVKELDPLEAGWLALAENIQRSDLSPIEEAQAYQERLATGITQEALGQRIGKTQSYIAGKLRLLKLSEPIQQLIKQGLITEGHAKQLLRVKSEYHQNHMAKMTAIFSASVADLKIGVDALLEIEEAEQMISRGFGTADDMEKIRQLLLKIKTFLSAHEETYYTWLTSFGIEKDIADLLEGLPWLDQSRRAILAVKMETANLLTVTTQAGKAIEPLRNTEPKNLAEALNQIEVARHWQNKLAEARIRGDRAAGQLLKDV